MASLIDKERLHDEFQNLLQAQNIVDSSSVTDLEKATILSVATANEEAQIDLSSNRTIFIVSTTKGNIEAMNNEQLTINNEKNCSLYLWHTAKQITRFFKNPNTPIVVSNACVSGAAAQLVALRELQTGNYDHAVVAGVDFVSKFIISGFQSFKALSPELCKPFDKERIGLNLGEAAATVIMNNEQLTMNNEDVTTAPPSTKSNTNSIHLIAGAVRNDANHISAPSRTGEGSYRALKSILASLESDNYTSLISFINAHGTATSYNDAMETVAITRAGLADVPTNSLKAYFGHTLGAAGVVECIISMRALQENLVLKSAGFNEQEFENPIHISQENHFSDKKYFIKLMSGFGGVNAALLFLGVRGS
jgi:3-oxoacyl-[acyl-carrier-protein] synthase-1